MKERLTCLLIFLSANCSLGATFETRNFQVVADSAEVAQSIAECAESSRKEVATLWSGEELPPWKTRCRVEVKVHHGSAQGLTSYEMRGGKNGDWEMVVEGSLDELVDSIVPHEVSHTVFASLFAHPLPRWADEGAAMLCETPSQQKRQRLLAAQIIKSKNRTPLRSILGLKEYPKNSSEIMAIYYIGYSLSDFLVKSAGRARYLELLDRAENVGWDEAVWELYGFDDIEALEQNWVEWVQTGHPPQPALRGKWVEQTETQPGIANVES